MPNIRESLQDLNPWWKKEFGLEFKDRDVYKDIQKFMPLPQIIALTGLRRVGKTTLMLKLASDFIGSGISPKNVVYFSFDEFRDAAIRDVIREYERIMEANIKDGKYLLLLDELQKLDGWENQLKGIYDTFGRNLKIIISGSESLFIRRKSRETLAGRIFEFKVEPLSFKEFLTFRGKELKPAGLYEKEFARLFDEFILTLGFPELVGVNEREIIHKYVQESIVEKVIYRDIARLFRVRDISLLASLLDILMDEPGQIIEMSGLSGELKISRHALSNYFAYLKDSFLIRDLYNFSKNKRKQQRKLKKYYPAIVSSSLLFREDALSRSKVLEWLAVNQLKAEFFWRDPYKNEVDIVIAGRVPVPIEVKYGKIELDGLLAFMRKFGVDAGYVISYDREETRHIGGKTIHVIPAFRFFSGENKLLQKKAL